MLDAPVIHGIQPAATLGQGNHHQCRCNSARSGWIVATTHSQAEFWAETNLQRRGYRVYLPRYSAKRRDPVLRTITRIVRLPLFPGYLFVHHDSRDSWRPIYETPGVRSVLKNGNQIQWARAGAVEAVEASEDLRRYAASPEPLYRPGAACGVDYGAFQNVPAVVLSVGREMALVSLMMFGCLREVAVSLDCLRPRDGS
jgi:transcription antitermination factor NusG